MLIFSLERICLTVLFMGYSADLMQLFSIDFALCVSQFQVVGGNNLDVVVGNKENWVPLMLIANISGHFPFPGMHQSVYSVERRHF